MSAIAEESELLSLKAMVSARDQLRKWVDQTPLMSWRGPERVRALGQEGEVVLKLELLQRTGTFKVRAAFLNIIRLTSQQRQAGVIAVSAGNHAVAVAYAAQCLGVSARLVVFKSANPLRLALCRHFGAEVVLADTPHDAFDLGQRLAVQQGRPLIHPFEGTVTALGTASLALEFCEQTPPLDAVITPIGGGGLAAGVSAAIKQLWPSCDVYGIEPKGAASMHASLKAGSPMRLSRIETIADSLGPPEAMPVTFALCQRYLAGVDLVDDEALRAAMRIMQQECKLAVEPAGAAAMAGLLGPLRARLRGARVGLIVCGSNIDTASYADLLSSSPI